MTNHVWKAFKIAEKWILIDATYGVEPPINNVWLSKPIYFYFNIQKESLRLTHYPRTYKWIQFFPKKPGRQFCNQPIYKTAFFNNGSALMTPTKREIEAFGNEITSKVKT
jgi:transglutaminase/protease-like cytokinesis protein 3